LLAIHPQLLYPSGLSNANKKVSMAAQRDPRADLPLVGGPDTAPQGATGIILPWRPVSSSTGEPVSDRTSGGRLGPARGLLLGLVAGAAIWGTLGVAAWMFFRTP